MLIFTKTYSPDSRENMTFVGTHVSDDVDALIRMVAIKNKISLSVLLRTVLKEWVEKNAHTKHKLIDSLAERAYNVWKAMYYDTGSRYANANVYVLEIKNELGTYGVSKDIIDRVIVQFAKLKSDGEEAK